MKRKIAVKLAAKILHAVRIFAYRRGFRPKLGSVFFSPSMNVAFRYQDVVKHIKRN